MMGPQTALMNQPHPAPVRLAQLGGLAGPDARRALRRPSGSSGLLSTSPCIDLNSSGDLLAGGCVGVFCEGEAALGDPGEPAPERASAARLTIRRRIGLLSRLRSAAGG